MAITATIMISTLRMTVAVYVVCGLNGVIIADTYGRALYCRKYLLRANIKRYEDYAEAEQAALHHLAAIVPYYVRLPDRLTLNEMVTKNKLIRDSKNTQE